MSVDVGDRMRSMVPDDLDMVFTWRNHPEVRRFMFSSGEIERDAHYAWFERASANPDRTLLIFERQDGPAGFVSFERVGCGIADWGFYLAPDAPRGTGGALGLHALAYAFENAKYHKVCGRVIAFNERSAAFHLKLGFQREGVLRDQYFDGSHYHDVICFGMLGAERPQRNRGTTDE